MILRTHFDNWMTACEEMNRSNLFFSFPMKLNILADFQDSDLKEMMDLRIKYSGLGSYDDPIEVNRHEYYQQVHFRELCTEDHSKLQDYSKSHSCSLSWATATIAAAEFALYQRGIEEKLSLEYLLECFKDDQREDTCEGVSMPDLQGFLSTVGLMSEQEAIRLGQEMCTSVSAFRYVFEIEKPEGLNRGGLMNLVNSGVPTLSLLGLDLMRIRYTDSMNTTSFPFIGQTSYPSVYGVVTGYDDDLMDGYWMVDIGVTPCEHLELKLPMKNDETGANYGGIAGYAFGLRYGNQDSYVASSDWDSIPLNVQSLIFDSNSFPDMIDVDLSNFTSLQSLQFREGSFASASSLTIIGYHIFLYSFIGLTQLNTILFHNHSFPITHSIILQDLSVHSIQVGEDCFNGIGSFEGRRLDSTSIAKLTLKNNGMLQEMKIPAGSFTQIKNIEMSNLQNLKMIEIEGEKGEKGAPFQSTSSFVTNGTPNLEVMKLGNKVCQSGSVFSIDSKMIKEVEIGKKCFQGTDKESQYGAKAQQFVMIDQPKLISTKIDKSSFVYFDTYNLMNNPKQMIANIAYSKSGNSSVSVDDLPSFSGVKEIVMKNLTSLEETVFGKGSFPNVTVINLSELPVVKNITLEEGSFGKTEELILVSE